MSERWRCHSTSGAPRARPMDRQKVATAMALLLLLLLPSSSSFSSPSGCSCCVSGLLPRAVQGGCPNINSFKHLLYWKQFSLQITGYETKCPFNSLFICYLLDVCDNDFLNTKSRFWLRLCKRTFIQL